MLETLYKIRDPETAPVEDAEYYELILAAKKVNGRVAYFIREIHGWWDDERKRHVNSYKTLAPEKGYATVDEAHGRYKEQRLVRARSGFVHSLSPDPYG